ncbi:MAG: DNA gyrase subunit A [Candidatus Liptonbacteria bacterium]|nr:DNA gyrase subunit A [Candidatus Liptonbacteria bacterium]
MQQIEPRKITQELQESYLDYAMSVIVARALPDVRDGLKPVQRRILWDMWDSGLTHSAKYRKSANVIGQVLGRYHPHSDTAVYDAMVRMAQDFSLRYPLIDGQGNFGSIDNDPPAAYRYTEARLSRTADEMLKDVEKETVDWLPNYDGTRQEPSVLPAKLPNLLLNGSAGIAVGLATNIPPHNLREVVAAVLHLADHPAATTADLTQFIKGPDFPTGGIIFDQQAIAAAYSAGRGAVTMRAVAEVQERKANQFDIVVTEIPYQVNKAELIRKIAELVQEKRVEGIRNLRDESDREGMRIVIELKSDVPPQKILNQLYRLTDLQKDFHLNVIALVASADAQGKSLGLQPQLLSLKDILVNYLEYRAQVVRRRTEFDLKKAKERAHILEGLMTALANIDAVIATIRRSADREDAKNNLIKRFQLTEVQANAILEMRLQALAALEQQRVEEELKEKRKLIRELELILKSPARIKEVIKEELRGLEAIYGDERRTKVIKTGLTTFREEDLVPEEEAIITFSASGYIKRLPPATFRAQKRGGKGLIGSDLGEEDFITQFFSCNTHDNLLFFTDRGRVFQSKAYEIPAASRTSKGKAIHNFLELPAEEGVTAVINYSPADAADRTGLFLIMLTKKGVIKKTALADFQNIRRSGIIAITLDKDDRLSGVRLSRGKDQFVITTRQGQSIRCAENQVRSMGRSAGGVRAMKLKKGDEVAGFDIVAATDSDALKAGRVLVVMANGFAKQTGLKEYKVQRRGGSGIRTATITAKTGHLVASRIVTTATELFALSAKGQIIRTNLSSVRLTGRAAQGVRIMNLRSGDRIAGITVI